MLLGNQRIWLVSAEIASEKVMPFPARLWLRNQVDCQIAYQNFSAVFNYGYVYEQQFGLILNAKTMMLLMCFEGVG